MIAHMKGREKALAKLGWWGGKAEWVALVCRHGGAFTRDQLCAEHIRHRKAASEEVLLRRLLSLDYAIERPNLSWLPTEPEKVAAFEEIGIDRRVLPARVYRGAACALTESWTGPGRFWPTGPAARAHPRPVARSAARSSGSNGASAVGTGA